MLHHDTTPTTARQVIARWRAPALDTNANKLSAERRDKRHALREHLRTITTDARVRGCGEVLGYSHAMVQLVRDVRGMVRYHGLETCRRVWLCPVCAARIAMDRSLTLERQVTAWLALGNAAWFLTLTFPHDYGDPLGATATLAAQAFTAVVQGRAWQEDRGRFGISGFVRALEVTVGAHGWHPHLHVLLFLERARGVRARRTLHTRVVERFAKRIVRAGLRAPDPRNCPLEPVTSADVGAYVAKASGAAREMTGWHLKEARGTSRTPFQLLVDLASHNEREDRERWGEWERCMRGKRQLTYSRGLRARLDALPAPLPPAADAAGERTTSPPAVEVALISYALWQRMMARPGMDRMLLAAYAHGGFTAARAMLVLTFGATTFPPHIDDHFSLRDLPAMEGPQ